MKHVRCRIASLRLFVQTVDAATTESIMSISTILLVVLILILIGAFPAWPHSREWGYYPSGSAGIIFIVLLILLLTGRI